jgi:hypothetical protein
MFMDPYDQMFDPESYGESYWAGLEHSAWRQRGMKGQCPCANCRKEAEKDGIKEHA